MVRWSNPREADHVSEERVASMALITPLVGPREVREGSSALFDQAERERPPEVEDYTCRNLVLGGSGVSRARWLGVWVACVLAAGATLAPVVEAGTNAQEVEEDNSLTTQFVTPHKDWGHGYVGGPVRALFVVNGGGYDGSWFAPETRLREVVELLQRFDISGDAILVGGSGKGEDFLGMALGQKRAERLLAKPYDVYVFANFALGKFPAKFQYLVMEQVAQGAGLVCCGPPASEFMIPKRRIDPLPALVSESLPVLDGKKPAEIINTYRLGKGRGAWLNYGAWALTPYKEFSWQGLAEYDYRMLWIGRAVLWAASREPQVSLSAILGGNLSVSRERSPYRSEVALTTTAAKPLKVNLVLELRRASDGWKTSLGKSAVTISGGEPTRVPVKIPRLRADHYFVDALVTSSRGVEAFGAWAFDVTSDLGVEKVEMDRAFAERGDRISGKAILRGTPPASSLLRLRFRDSYDRVLDQRDVKVVPRQTEYAFDYRPGAFDTILMRLEAALFLGREEVEVKDATFTVPKRRRGQFNFLQWDTPRDVLGYYAWERLKQAGMTLCLVGSFSESQAIPALQASDISLVPYSTRILDPKDENGYMKPCCWNDEPNVTKHVQGIVDNQKKHREHGVFVYSLGDEGVTLGCCVHPACIAAYRHYLAAQYGTVEKLNASWSSDYKSFDEVDLLDHKDNMETGALAGGLYARWFDRQAFARFNLMQFSGRFVKAYQQLDPEGVTGFEGTGGFGDDYDAILGINTFYSPYPGIGDDIIRSAAPRELIRANWMGYSKTGDALSDAGWRMVMKGMDSIWYWMWTGVGNWRGYLTPTLDFSPAIADLTEEMKPVRRGLGDLLLQSKMLHGGIAVFYSVPSALSHSVENSREFVGPDATHQTWTQLTYDLGLDFRYVTSAMLKRGALNTKEFKVLLLPMAQAIAPEEATAIRSFAQAGGVVVADVRPGIYDGHCKPVTPGVLDDLFGTKRASRDKAERTPITIRTSLADETMDLQLAQARVDPGVQPRTARALGHADKTPVLYVNHVGGGCAILLNFQLLSDQPDEAQAAATRRFLKSLYGVAGVTGWVTSTAPDGSPLPMTETRVWQSGNALVFGLWRHMQCEWFSPKTGTEAGPPVAAMVTFPFPQHVYDLRAGKYLGKVTQIHTQLRWGRANFFLAIPYQIKGVNLTLSAAPRAGQTLTATIRLRIPPNVRERHAVFVEVTDPKGHEAEGSRQVIILNGGSGQVQIPVAYNAMAGKWRLRATELFSGKSAEAMWAVP